MVNENISRKRKAILRKKKIIKRRRYSLALLFIFILITFIRICYVEEHSKDLYYAVDHYMTSGFLNDKKVLRVDSMKLLFSDGKFAKVEIHGMYYKSPYFSKTYTANFEKDWNNSWKLKKVDEIGNVNITK